MRRLAATMAVVALVGGQLLPTKASAAPTCFGRVANIVGTSGDDELSKSGTGVDVFVALAGDDFLDYEDYTGNDFMCGNSGDDDLNPASGSDRLNGGAGKDRLRAGEGSDKLLGGDGDDILYHSLTYTPYLADGERDVLDGGAGTDTCVVEFDASTSQAVDTWRNCEHLVEVSQ
jgi:Ca2+-binding RTX toxin-like protein